MSEQKPVLIIGKGGELKALKDLPIGSKLYLDQPSAIPDSCVIAPFEPTCEMLNAGVSLAIKISVHGQDGWHNYIAALYKELLLHAPKLEFLQ